jgi:hypothetical protein
LLGALNLGNLYLLNAAVLLLLLFVIQKNKAALSFRGGLGEAISKFPVNNFILFFLAALTGFSLVKICFNLVNAPFGWDSLNYHFTFAVEWLKHGNLDTPLTVSDNPCPSYFPINGSLIYLWWMFPFKNAMLADLGQVPFFAMVFLSIFKLCRKMEVSQEQSFLAAVLFTATPNYFRQMNIAYVDIMVCAWLLVALNFLFNLRKDFSLKNTVILGLSLGLLIGTKTVALSFSFILIFFFIYLMFWERFASGWPILFLVFFAAVIATGSVSYIKNFLETGNPLYPLSLEIVGRTVFKGVLDKANFTVFSDPKDYSLGKILFHEGMGAGAILFIIPGLAVFVSWLIKKRKVSAFDAILLSSFLYFFVCYRYLFSLPNVRYIYPLFAIGYVIALTAITRINFPVKALRWMVLVCVIASLPEMARKSELVLSLIASFLIFAVLLISFKYWQKNFLRSVFALAIAGLFVLPFINDYYNRNEFESYVKMTKYTGFWPDAAKAWEWLNRNTCGNNIAYIGRPVPFPLYGSNFKNDVYYASVNRTDPARLHCFPQGHYSWGKDFLSMHKSFEEVNNYRSGADYSVWLSNLSRRNTDYLFVYSLHQTKEIDFPMEDVWAKQHPDRFCPVFLNGTVHIYKFLR